MCFFRRGHSLRIALRNKKCYKIMDIAVVDSKVILTPYIYSQKSFTLGDTIEAAQKLSDRKFINALRVNKLQRLDGEVVHSYDLEWLEIRRADFASCFPCHAIVECEIPKGTFYWHNKWHREYASTSLKLTKIIWNPLEHESKY